MKVIAALLILLSFGVPVYSQDRSTQIEDVLKVVDRLFEGMKIGDSSMIHNTFTQDAAMYTIFTDRNGTPVKHEGSLMEFVTAVGSPHDEIWNEQIWDSEVKIDGHFAQVWTHYVFYAGNTFSHCGIDAFHLFKSGDGWRIFHLTDTRNWQDCEVPDEIRRKFH